MTIIIELIIIKIRKAACFAILNGVFSCIVLNISKSFSFGETFTKLLSQFLQLELKLSGMFK